MKEQSKMGRRKILALRVAIAVFLLLAITASGVVFLRSFVRGKGDINPGNIDGDKITLDITELVSGKSVTSSQKSFTLDKTDSEVSFSLNMSNKTSTDLIHSISIAVKSLTVDDTVISPLGNLAMTVKSAVLVYYDGEYIGTLANLTEAGTYSFPVKHMLPSGNDDAHTVSFRLHTAAEAYAGSKFTLTVTDTALNADARDYIFVDTEEEFSRAADDISSGILLPGNSGAGTPRIVITSSFAITKNYNYTFRNPVIIDLYGYSVSGSGSITFSSDGVITSSKRLTSLPTFDGSIILDSDDSALDISGLSLSDGTDASSPYTSAVTIRKYSPDKVRAIIAKRIEENIAHGINQGTSVDALSSLSFYLGTVATLTAPGCTLSGSVITAPARDATIPSSLTLHIEDAEDFVYSFKIFGNDDEAVLKTLRTGALAHLEELNGKLDSITSDLFLPTSVRKYGAVIEWISDAPDAMSDDGRIQSGAADGQEVRLYAKVRINEKLYTLEYTFHVSTINNELRFSNFIAQLSPLTLKEVWKGDSSTTSDDFLKSHQFLPIGVQSSKYHYTKAFTSPDTTLTTAKLEWEGYEDIGLEELTYSQDATYNYISVYTNSDGEQAVLLNTPVFSSFAQINLTAKFTGDDEVYTSPVNIIIETGNYKELLDEVFNYVQKQYNSIDIYKNIVRSRINGGIIAEKGDFGADVIYSLSSSSLSSTKYSITFDTSVSGGVFSATETKLSLSYNGKSCPAYAPLDSPDGYGDDAIAGDGYYIKVSTPRGAYYVSAKDAGVTVTPDGDEIIDGTGKYFYHVISEYRISVDMSKASSVESRVPINVTVKYTSTPTVEDTRSLYVIVPAVIRPDDAGFSNYSVFSTVKYQLMRHLPTEEQTGFDSAFETVTDGIRNKTPAYILVKDIERCSGNDGAWYSGIYDGEELTINHGKVMDSLRLYVKRANSGVNSDDVAIYDFLRLIEWATGSERVAAAEYLVGTYSGLSLTTISDGKQYLNPGELSVIKSFYQSITHVSDAEWNTLLSSVSTTPTANGVPSRVISDPDTLNSTAMSLSNGNGQTYFKYTELLRWALNEQDFPKSAFIDGTSGTYPIGNPPNGGELSYNRTYTTSNGNRFIFRQTGNNSLHSGYFNEDNTEYISEREEVVLYAFWPKISNTALTSFRNAFISCTTVPTYLEENAVSEFVTRLYAALGYPKAYTAQYVEYNGEKYPAITSADGSLAALTHFTNLTKIAIVGEYSQSGSEFTTGLPAFLHTDSLAKTFNRISGSQIAGKLTELTMYNCASGYVTFTPDGLSEMTSLSHLDLGMNYGLKSVGTVLNANYKSLSYLDVSGAGASDKYKEYPLAVLSMNVGKVYYSPDNRMSGRRAEKVLLTRTETSEILAYLKELSTIDGQYVQLQKSIIGTGGTSNVFWQLDSGNRIYDNIVTSTGFFDPYSTAADATEMIGQLTNYFYCNSSDPLTLNGETLQPGYLYPIKVGADGSVSLDSANGVKMDRVTEPPDPSVEWNDIKYSLTLTEVNKSTTTAEDNVYVIPQNDDTRYYVSTSSSGGSTISRNSFMSVYYKPTKTVTEYKFEYSGSQESITSLIAYLATPGEVEKFNYTVTHSGTIVGSVTVTTTQNRYYAQSATSARDITDDIGRSKILYYGANSGNYDQHVDDIDAIAHNSAEYTYDDTKYTVPSLENTSVDALIAALPVELEDVMKNDMEFSDSKTQSSETRISSVREITDSATLASEMSRLSSIAAGKQLESVYRYNGTAGSANYIEKGSATSYSFTRYGFYRLVFSGGMLKWEDTGLTYSATATGDTMESILADANALKDNPQRGNYLGMYVYYDGKLAVTVNGHAYTPGCVYRIIWNDEGTAFTYDDANGGKRVCEQVNGNDFQNLPLEATETGGIYYLTEATNYYASNKFYVMTRGEYGYYYLSRFTDAIPLLGINESGASSDAYRIKNDRLYITSSEDYSGTGGSVYADITAVVIIDGTEYRRVFRVYLVG